MGWRKPAYPLTARPAPALRVDRRATGRADGTVRDSAFSSIRGPIGVRSRSGPIEGGGTRPCPGWRPWSIGQVRGADLAVDLVLRTGARSPLQASWKAGGHLRIAEPSRSQGGTAVQEANAIVHDLMDHWWIWLSAASSRSSLLCSRSLNPKRHWQPLPSCSAPVRDRWRCRSS